MPQVLILGAGKSSGSLIQYLQRWGGCDIVLADVSSDQLAAYTGSLKTVLLKPDDHQMRYKLIRESYLVISMLPAVMHPAVANDCLEAGVHLATASYVSDAMRELEPKIKEKGLWFMNECGLDPGLDHMSAMQMFKNIRNEGGQIVSFHSYCGGLVAPESMDNPWGYKFSWNPRNVILAGQGTARYQENGELKFIPYPRLFKEAGTIRFDDQSMWDAYPNRDSLAYKEIYGLEDAETIVRGTLRYKGYCEAWNIFVQMGITDDSYTFPLREGSTYREFASAFLPGTGLDFSARIQNLSNGGFSKEAIDKVLWTGLFDERPIGLERATPAMILQALLEEKWRLQEHDKDLVLMQHQIGFYQGAKRMLLTSSLQVKGQDSKHTAMAQTVGMPLAITCRLFLEGKFSTRGVLIPINPEVYEPVLAELESQGIRFTETLQAH